MMLRWLKEEPLLRKRGTRPLDDSVQSNTLGLLNNLQRFRVMPPGIVRLCKAALLLFYLDIASHLAFCSIALVTLGVLLSSIEIPILDAARNPKYLRVTIAFALYVLTWLLHGLEAIMRPGLLVLSALAELRKRRRPSTSTDSNSLISLLIRARQRRPYKILRAIFVVIETVLFAISLYLTHVKAILSMPHSEGEFAFIWAGNLALLLAVFIAQFMDLVVNLTVSSEYVGRWLCRMDRRRRGDLNIEMRLSSAQWLDHERRYLLGKEFNARDNHDNDAHDVLYATPRTIPKGESIVIPPMRRQIRDRLPHFLRCNCCVNSTALVRQVEDSTGWMQKRADLRRAMNHWGRTVEVDGSRQLSYLHHLCKACENVLSRLHTHNGKIWNVSSYIRSSELVVFEHLESACALKSSASQGCHLCTILWQRLSPDQQSELLAYDTYLRSEDAGSLDASLATHEKQAQAMSRRLRRCIRLAIKPSDDSILGTNDSTPWKRIIPHYGDFNLPQLWVQPPVGDTQGLARTQLLKQMEGREVVPTMRLFWSPTLHDPISFSTGSEVSMKVIQDWYDKLDVGSESKSDWMPSRVVDVSKLSWSNGVITGSISVQRTDAIELAQPYIALSHCWGKEPFTTYNHHTKTIFEDGCPVDELAATFREAAAVTLRLGYRYLWIDSLCILQDDDDDKLTELPAMAKIYSTASLTIAAIASRKAQEGLFRQVDTLANSRCLVTFHEKMSDPRKAWFIRIPSDETSEGVSLTSWDTRGWTLQERYLSSRIVYFGQKTLWFEAKNIQAGQTTGKVTPAQDLDLYVKDDDSNQSGEIASENYNKTWWNWVKEFTHRHLSNKSDRSVAMLGLAQYKCSFDQYAKSQYIAGLWRESLASDLLWYVDIDPQERREPEWRGPSWSWLSVDGGINNDTVVNIQDVCGIEIKDVHDPLQHNNDTLPPTMGKGSYIELRGCVRPFQWSPDAGHNLYYVTRSDVDFGRRDDNLSSAVLDLLPTASKEPVGPRCFPMWKQDSMDSEANPVAYFVPDTSDLEQIPATLQCLAFSIQPASRSRKQDFAELWRIRGLALTEIEPDIEGSSVEGEADRVPCYERVGYFEVECKSEGVYMLMDLNDRVEIEQYPRRVRPNTDPARVFEGHAATLMRLF